MSLDLVDYEKKAKKAVKTFWETRLNAKEKGKNADKGERSAVTSGKNLDGFIELMIDIIHANGLPGTKIMLEKKVLTLPGFFRPTKLWDVLAFHKGQLIIALEFKSHVGPSFGNNANNRCEEALGTAIDFWTAFKEGSFGDIDRPFVGYLTVLEDAEKSRLPIMVKEPHYQVFPAFKDSSYATRYDILCKRLMDESLYTAATMLFSPREAAKNGSFTCISNRSGLKHFISKLAAHVASIAAN